ncbi:UTP--glucose-1-phosphate uridylyltransferase [Bacillus sp. BRMEA1]|uniref:sugar phosphate nucleotidyltransferase n=1 Tax=Neobacillus endophyticus TaxID=2738405 RepID=UPI001563AA51|nr:sugar phosphate nucleotidyltransferase [Neobacillus endophyticus]NRD79175.1 UTP--glucose-1-phosphate uridylyltransferase [Neobacillus endophyticus]
MEIKKAIIPVDVTITPIPQSTILKTDEMRSVMDQHTIQPIIEEAIRSGIESILIVIGGEGISTETEGEPLNKEHIQLQKEIQSLNNNTKIHYVHHNKSAGLSNAILSAETFIEDEPFAVLESVDIFISETPALEQLIQVFHDFETQLIGVKQVGEMEVNKYGIIDSSGKSDDIYLVTDLIDRPAIHHAPSNIAVMGRYILKPSIFPVLRRLEKEDQNDDQWTEALYKISRQEELLALELEGNHLGIEAI